MNNIGIMGGTFDPPHIAHMAMAECALKTFSLDKVIFVPTGRVYYKEESNTPPYHRLNMTRILIGGRPQFEVSEIDIKREGYTYTADTLEEMHKLYEKANLFFIVGADSLNYMDKWKNPEKLFANCTVIAIGRDGFDDEENRAKARVLKDEFGADIRFANMPIIDVSSSDIRDRIKSGKSVKHMIDDRLFDYIKENGLYND